MADFLTRVPAAATSAVERSLPVPVQTNSTSGPTVGECTTETLVVVGRPRGNSGAVANTAVQTADKFPKQIQDAVSKVVYAVYNSLCRILAIC